MTTGEMNIARKEDLDELIGIVISHVASTKPDTIENMVLIKRLVDLRDKIKGEDHTVRKVAEYLHYNFYNEDKIMSFEEHSKKIIEIVYESEDADE